MNTNIQSKNSHVLKGLSPELLGTTTWTPLMNMVKQGSKSYHFMITMKYADKSMRG